MKRETSEKENDFSKFWATSSIMIYVEGKGRGNRKLFEDN